MLHFCTYFDIHYIHRGLALYQSLLRNVDCFILWILCFDDRTYEILNFLDIPNIKLIHWRDFERSDDALSFAKANRSRVEYYWTCTPSLLLYIFIHYPEIQTISYLDADVYFFSSASIIFKSIEKSSILIIPHDYSPEYIRHETSGIYNVGVMAFRADENGLSCLRWWRDRCLEWCFNRHEDGKMGDQAYLNDWPERFKGVTVSDHAGINAAPWNVSKYPVILDEHEEIHIADQPLVCYHFHGIQFCTNHLVFFMGYNVPLSKIFISSIYYPYLRRLKNIETDLRKKGVNIPLPKAGIPWRYITGRIFSLQPVRHFMWLN